jgi:hypothetical protein
MNDAEDSLVLITCLVGVICGISVSSKQGLIMGSVVSTQKGAVKKYVVRKGRRRTFYIYLGIVFLIALSVALLLTRDIKSISFFIGFNMLSVGYFLTYFVLLEPKDKSL